MLFHDFHIQSRLSNWGPVKEAWTKFTREVHWNRGGIGLIVNVQLTEF